MQYTVYNRQLYVNSYIVPEYEKCKIETITHNNPKSCNIIQLDMIYYQYTKIGCMLNIMWLEMAYFSFAACQSRDLPESRDVQGYGEVCSAVQAVARD